MWWEREKVKLNAGKSILKSGKWRMYQKRGKYGGNLKKTRKICQRIVVPEENLTDGERGGPLGPQDIQANRPVSVDVGMVDLSGERNLNIYNKQEKINCNNLGCFSSKSYIFPGKVEFTWLHPMRN